MNKLWFADYNKVYAQPEQESEYLYSSKIKLITDLEQLFPEFQKESEFLWSKEKQSLRVFLDSEKFDDKQFPYNSWKKIPLMVWGILFPQKTIFFSKISNIIYENDEVISCQIAKLAPKSKIHSHCGETNAIYRIHLCLKTKWDSNFNNTAYFDLNGDKKIWKEGEAFGFIDAVNHKAFNNSDEDRYVLIVDVLRSEFKQKKYYIISRIITSQLYLMILSYMGFLNIKYLTHSNLIFILQIILFLPIMLALLINKTYSKIYNSIKRK
jgi:hypothetical protein